MKKLFKSSEYMFLTKNYTNKFIGDMCNGERVSFHLVHMKVIHQFRVLDLKEVR